MGFLGGGFFGSGAKSSETSTTSQQSGFSEVDGPATGINVNAPGKNSRTTINLVDQGAVQGALDLVGETLGFLRANQELNANAFSSQVTKAYDLANQARQSETSGAINNFLKYGAIVVGIALAAWALKGSR